MGFVGTSSEHLTRVIKTGNLLLVRAAAIEAGHVSLQQALQIYDLIAVQEPQHRDAAAVRLAGRVAAERQGVTLDDLLVVVLALRPHASNALRAGLVEIVSGR